MPSLPSLADAVLAVEVVCAFAADVVAVLETAVADVVIVDIAAAADVVIVDTVVIVALQRR